MQEISVGKTYRHYKGNMYKIIALAKHSETVEDMIVYQNTKEAIEASSLDLPATPPVVKEGDIWVRPASMWNETVDDKGTLRFTLC